MAEYRTEIVDRLVPWLLRGLSPGKITTDLEKVKQESRQRLMSGDINVIAYRESPGDEWQVYRG